jgi:hypothetical protein
MIADQEADATDPFPLEMGSQFEHLLFWSELTETIRFPVGRIRCGVTRRH